MARLGVEAEVDAYLGQQRAQAIGVERVLGVEKMFAKGKQRDGPVHGTCIHIDVAQSVGKFLGHRALSAGAVTVDGYHNFLHIKIYYKWSDVKRVVWGRRKCLLLGW